jgi:hypothetical protein
MCWGEYNMCAGEYDICWCLSHMFWRV